MKICVIGGGASGSMCAIMLARNGHKVTLFEKNQKIGRKLYITGKGRCNVTNAVTGNEFLANVVHGAKFMLSSETRFNSSDTMHFFEELGVPLKIERGNRVFPVSDKSSDIIDALLKELKKQRVEIRFETIVNNIIIKDNKAVGVITDKEEFFDAVIVATGGKSYEATGSTGDGYKWAQLAGHDIIKPVPSLMAINIEDKDVFALEGLSLKNVCINAYNGGKCIYQSPVGEMLFTSGGISGPLVLSASAYINRLEPKETKIFIDFKPAINELQLQDRINREISMLGAKQVSSLLELLLPKSLVGVFANRLGVLMEDKANQLSSEKRKLLASMLKGFELTINSYDGFDRAVVTSGGVATKQISPRNMQSKLIKNLYFIGEVLDIDALTGGFNLQLAFSTAVACASDIKEE